MELLTRDNVLGFLRINDYALSGFIHKALVKCEKDNGHEFYENIMREINHTYETGYHKGYTGWETFRRISPPMYDKMKWANWKKIYSEARKAVLSRMESKPIGAIVEEIVEEAIAKQEVFH